MTTKFRVEDATCGHCKATIEGAVSSLRGVDGAELDLDSKVLSVEHDTGTSAEEIASTIEAAGYSPQASG